MFPLDRDSTVPLSEQIDIRLRAMISERQLLPGVKLTSIRQLAHQLTQLGLTAGESGDIPRQRTGR